MQAGEVPHSGDGHEQCDVCATPQRSSALSADDLTHAVEGSAVETAVGAAHVRACRRAAGHCHAPGCKISQRSPLHDSSHDLHSAPSVLKHIISHTRLYGSIPS